MKNVSLFMKSPYTSPRSILLASLLLAVLFCSKSVRSQQTVLDLRPLGVPSATISKCAESRSIETRMPLFGITYVGDELLLITYKPPCTSFLNGTAQYTALLIDHKGTQLGTLSLNGGPDQVLQRIFNAQPSNNVLFKTGDELSVYSLDLKTFTTTKLPERAQLRLTPDRQRIAVLAQSGNEAEVYTAKIGETLGQPRHLSFDERAVRDQKLAVSNNGDVAHAVLDLDSELGVSSQNANWPSPPQIGKFQKPLAFVTSDRLLLSIMSKQPFPPTLLYLWSRDGKIQKISGASGADFWLPQISVDGRRVLVTKTSSNFFVAMLGGFDCGDCGDSYSYTLIDIPSARVIRAPKSGWKCEDALSPSGHEIAELCGDTLRFYPEP